MAQYKTRDPQNPYRTGVLVGNYVEDKFGAQFAQQEVSRSLLFVVPSNYISTKKILLLTLNFKLYMIRLYVTYIYLVVCL